MDADELADVIARARRGDPAAFDALVNAYGARLYGYFYRLTGSRHDAEDLLQEVFVRLVRMIGHYAHDGRFEGWLFRIATNLVRDRVRRSKTSRGLENGSDPVCRDSPQGASHKRGLTRFQAHGEAESVGEWPDLAIEGPSAALERAEDVDRLQRAIGKLPEAEREVILLRHFSQLSFREIAEQMGTPLGTALARAHRGLARLRELMGE